MHWQQFVMQLDGLDPEAVSDALESTGALSVTLGDAADQPILEPAPGETPLWSNTEVTALYDDQADLGNLAEQLAFLLGINELPAHRFETLGDRDWEREWMKDFRPMQFGQRLWICPGDMPIEDPDAVIVKLDPGLAFGTGTHPTTAMCLSWLDGLDINGESVLDFGCGSGVLAIAALKLGAGNAVGTDIDDQALTATKDNATRNGVDVPVFLPGEVPRGPYDLVLANILAGPLVELATHISEYVKTGGRLALSGILEEQAASVRKAYEAWISFDEPELAHQDGQTWVRLSGRRKTS